MDELESEVALALGQPKAQRPADTAAKARRLVSMLLDAARDPTKGPSDSGMLIERADTWADALAAVVDDSSATHIVERVSAVKCRSSVAQAAREYHRCAGDVVRATRDALHVVAFEQRIVSLYESSAEASESMIDALIVLARALSTLSGLLGAQGKHQEAAAHSRQAAEHLSRAQQLLSVLDPSAGDSPVFDALDRQRKLASRSSSINALKALCRYSEAMSLLYDGDTKYVERCLLEAKEFFAQAGEAKDHPMAVRIDSALDVARLRGNAHPNTDEQPPSAHGSAKKSVVNADSNNNAVFSVFSASHLPRPPVANRKSAVAHRRHAELPSRTAMVPIGVLVGKAAAADDKGSRVGHLAPLPLTGRRAESAVDVVPVVPVSDPATPERSRDQRRAPGRARSNPAPRAESGLSAASTATHTEVARKYSDWLALAVAQSFGDYGRRFKAALKIQCCWRSAVARLVVFNRRQAFYHYVHFFQRAAALAGLGCFRTFAAKRTLVRVLASERDNRAALAARESTEHRAVLCICRYLRSFLRRRRQKEALMQALKIELESKLRQYEAAAIILQRWWPLAKSEKAYWVQRNKELHELKCQHDIRARRDHAATTIQALVRGVRARRHVRAFKRRVHEERRRNLHRLMQATDVVRIVLRETRARLARIRIEDEINSQRRNVAASRIREGWMVSLERRKIRELRGRIRLMQIAARKIQRCWWYRVARRDLKVNATIRRTCNVIRIEREWKQERSARRIQCAYRCHLARRKARRMKASIGRAMLLAIWLFQRVGRAFDARCSVGELRVISRKRAMLEARILLEQRTARVTHVQSLARAILSTRLVSASRTANAIDNYNIHMAAIGELLREKQATAIQRVYRGYRARTQVAECRTLAHELAENVRKAVLRIQCFFRCCIARRKIATLRFESRRRAAKRRQLHLAHDQLMRDKMAQLSVLESIERGLIHDEFDAFSASLDNHVLNTRSADTTTYDE